jgi:D-serine deaminase-like pyridoxal phosphate-dependent protein
VILDAGAKTFGTAARGLPRSRTAGLVVDRLNDEHLIATTPPGSEPPLGSVHRFDVAAAGPAVLANWRYLVADGDVVVDVWPIVGRDADAPARLVADGGAA